MILHENDNVDVHIYMDDKTGNYYYFDGEKLVLMGSKPSIGDKGNQEFQDEEEEERQKQAAKEKAEEAEENNPEIDDDSNDSDDSDDDSDDSNDSTGQGSGSPSKEKTDSDAEFKRLKRIKDKFNDKETAMKVSDEAESKVNKEKMTKAAKDAAKYRNSGIVKFKESLNGFIKKEIGEVKEKSWSKINKKYAGTGTIKAGTSKHASGKIPVINVYFDRSGSWDADKTKVGEQAIASLNDYVRQHKLKINLFYFNYEVFNSDVPGGRGYGGTYPGPVMNHINATKPDNVIIMTDGDFDGTKDDEKFPYATVPGGVWMLFKDEVSTELQKKLKGKKLTKSFMLD